MKKPSWSKVRDIHISVGKYNDDSTFIVSGGFTFADNMSSVSLAPNEVSRATAKKIVALVNEIYNMNLKVE